MANGKEISIDGFLHELDVLLDDFVDEAQDELNETVKDVGKMARDELRTYTPPGAGRYHDWGDYQSGFSMKSSKDRQGNLEVTVYNKKKPWLTHLLEDGHVNADGHGRAQAFPHIALAEEHALEELRRRLGYE